MISLNRSRERNQICLVIEVDLENINGIAKINGLDMIIVYPILLIGQQAGQLKRKGKDIQNEKFLFLPKPLN